MSINRTAAEGFLHPDTYDKGRPDYPIAAVEALAITPDMRVADLGCGTGKLTRLLEPTTARIVGIEPLAPMLAGLHKNLPSTRAFAATAESMSVRDGSFDLVVCASAFHWFDHAKAIPEIHRVLASGGRLAIIWNRRDTLTGWPAVFWDITEAHRGDTPGYRTGAWRDALDASPLFGDITEQWFDHVQTTDIDGLLARVASISFIEILPTEERERVMNEARTFIETHPDTRGKDVLELPYRTALYTAPRR